MQEIGVALVGRDGAATGRQRIVLLNVKYEWLVVSGDDSIQVGEGDIKKP